METFVVVNIHYRLVKEGRKLSTTSEGFETIFRFCNQTFGIAMHNDLMIVPEPKIKPVENNRVLAPLLEDYVLDPARTFGDRLQRSLT